MTFFNKVHSFIAVIKQKNSEELLQQAIFDTVHSAYFQRSEDGRIEIAFCFRSSEPYIDINNHQSGQTTCLVFGDDAEWQESRGETCMVSGTSVEFNISSNYLKLVTSIVGLPPVFIYRDPISTIVTTDIYLLTRISGVNLHFNRQAVSDLCQIGYPVSGMTLFKEVMLVPGGSSLILEADGYLRQLSMAVFETEEEGMDWPAYVELQTDTLRKAMEAIDVSKSFFSLTAGLDTRAIMAMLVAENRSLPAYTLTGKRLTLDAMIAKDLCKAYHFSHTTVTLGDSFYSNLPNYITEASRLSGGLTCIDQAHEVYFYRSVGSE